MTFEEELVERHPYAGLVQWNRKFLEEIKQVALKHALQVVDQLRSKPYDNVDDAFDETEANLKKQFGGKKI